MLNWQEVKSEFVWEGSWRDICVPDTTTEDWEAVLQALRQSEFHTRFQTKAESAAWPSGAQLLFQQAGAPPTLMSIFANEVQLNCHFFDPGEIEFDLDPRQVRGEADLNALLRFMALAASVTGKNALMTPENMHDAPFIRVAPNRKRGVLVVNGLLPSPGRAKIDELVLPNSP